MSPAAVDEVAPIGGQDGLALSSAGANGTSTQPFANGKDAEPVKGEASIKDTGDGELKTMNERFNFDPDVPRVEKKKKKKKSNFMKRGPTALVKNRGTGFEDFFCDPPMTPAEAEEEKNVIYSPDRPFVDRIEECLQRYRARRRMDSARNNLFDKYLALGGIDSSPRMFQGTKTLDTANATNNEIREMTAGDVIHRGNSSSRWYNPSEAEKWDVDFAGVVAGYFSERIFKLAGTDLAVIKMAADVVENFLNYVLHHDVCPEYADDIKKAKAICQDAMDQITRCFRVIWEGPGDFGIACLALFDHGKRKVFDPDKVTVQYNMPVDHAQRIFYTNVAVHKFLFQKLRGKANPEVVDEFKQAFEVVDILGPDEKQALAYLGVKNAKGETGKIKPCGKLTLKPVVLEDGYDKGSCSGIAPGLDEVEEFVMDWSVMDHMTIGMKLKLIICVLDNDFKFINAFTDARPRYYTFLPQELMINFKEPVPNEREAPSVSKPDVGVEDSADAKVDD